MHKHSRLTRIIFYLSSLALHGCALFRQDPSTVLIRKADDLYYSQPPSPVQPVAETQWMYAALSAIVYPPTTADKVKARDLARRRSVVKSNAHALVCPDFLQDLTDGGWFKWTDFPDGDFKTQAENVNLGIEVWQNNRTSPVSVVVVFRGTEFWSFDDWDSNLHWITRFIPGNVDEYTLTVRKLNAYFIEKYKEHAKADSQNGIDLRHATLIATGHSLGGGLAQQFAYALLADESVPRVTEIYAFDPSPVTGYFSVEDTRNRDENVKVLKTNRIFEKGEILSYPREIIALIVPPSGSDPAISGTRYNLFPSFNPIADHSIDELACGMWMARKQGADRNPAADAILGVKE